MSATPNLGSTLGFLDELSRNNNKAWFDSHRPPYEIARAAFEQFINNLIDEFRVSDHLEGLSAKVCVARIYRDVRFSRDKSPYKTNLAAMIAPGGWRSTRQGYYISIGAQEQSMVAGGLYNPSAEQLNRFRQAIDKDAAPFKKLTQARTFMDAFNTVEGNRLKTSPKGFDRTHPEIALLQLKQITVVHRFSEREVLGHDFIGKVAGVCRAMKPFLNYMTVILE
jgi:uncharacterized protein (TIGR02453 family)